MEIEILEQKENKLLFRNEIKAKLLHIKESTPKRIETRNLLAAKVNADADRTCIIKIDGEYGMGQSNALFHVYDNADNMKTVELPHILKRNGFISEEEKS